MWMIDNWWLVIGLLIWNVVTLTVLVALVLFKIDVHGNVESFEIAFCLIINLEKDIPTNKKLEEKFV